MPTNTNTHVSVQRLLRYVHARAELGACEAYTANTYTNIIPSHISSASLSLTCYSALLPLRARLIHTL